MCCKLVNQQNVDAVSAEEVGRWPRFIKEQRETSTKTDATALIDGEGGVWPIMRMPSLAWQPSDFVISQAQARNSAVVVSNQEGTVVVPGFHTKD